MLAGVPAHYSFDEAFKVLGRQANYPQWAQGPDYPVENQKVFFLDLPTEIRQMILGYTALVRHENNPRKLRVGRQGVGVWNHRTSKSNITNERRPISVEARKILNVRN